MQYNDFQLLIHILQKPFRSRTEKDHEALLPSIKQIQFFKERDIKGQDLNDIVHCLTYEYHEKGKNVFEYGQLGDKFYIILSGSAKVLIPSPHLQESYNQVERMQKILVIKKQEYLDFIQKQKVNEREREINKDKEKVSTHTSNITQFGQNQILKTVTFDDKQQSPRISARTPAQQNSFKFDNAFDLTELQVSKDLLKTYEQKAKTPKGFRNNEKSILFKEYCQNFEIVKKIKEEEIIKLEHQLENEIMISVVNLHAGQSFGEIALIKNRKRAATIKCTSNCHLAVISKINYEKVLMRIEKKNLEKLVEFLQQIPFLAPWSKGALERLQYSFEQRIFKRNQIVYKEGDPSNMVYFIKNGEFEVTKKLKISEFKDIHMKQLYQQDIYKENSDEQEIKQGLYTSRIKDTLTKSSENIFQEQGNKSPGGSHTNRPYIPKKVEALSRSKLVSNQQQVIENFKIAHLTPGAMFGEEDILSNRFYTTSVACKSEIGSLFCIKDTEFFRKLKPNKQSWKVIVLLAIAKEKALNIRIQRIRKLLLESMPVKQSYALSIFKQNDLLTDYKLDHRDLLAKLVQIDPLFEKEYKHFDQMSQQIQNDKNCIPQMKDILQMENPNYSHRSSNKNQIIKKIGAELSLLNLKQSLKPKNENHDNPLNILRNESIKVRLDRGFESRQRLEEKVKTISQERDQKEMQQSGSQHTPFSDLVKQQTTISHQLMNNSTSSERVFQKTTTIADKLHDSLKHNRFVPEVFSTRYNTNKDANNYNEYLLQNTIFPHDYNSSFERRNLNLKGQLLSPTNFQSRSLAGSTIRIKDQIKSSRTPMLSPRINFENNLINQEINKRGKIYINSCYPEESVTNSRKKTKTPDQFIIDAINNSTVMRSVAYTLNPRQRKQKDLYLQRSVLKEQYRNRNEKELLTTKFATQIELQQNNNEQNLNRKNRKVVYMKSIPKYKLKNPNKQNPSNSCETQTD